MQTNEILQTLDQLIQKRSILNHPFYRAWLNGELSMDQLAVYAGVYYPHVAAFPGYLECAIQTSNNSLVRNELERNLADELSHPKAHPDLWLDFAEGLGLEREGVVSAGWRPAAQNIVDTFDRLTRGESSQALAALYAYESQQPEVAGEKVNGLRTRYGLRDEKTLAYFDVHAEADLEHRAGERLALAHCMADGGSAVLALAAASQALDAYWGLLDGICQEAGVALDC